MKKLISLFVVFAALTIAGCTPVYRTSHEIVPPPTERGRMCANQCLDKRAYCNNSCRSEMSSCKTIGQLESGVAYLLYVDRQKEDGRPIEKTKSDFEGRNQCSTKPCEASCEEIFNLCHINCGGQVIEQTHCVQNCDKDSFFSRY